MTVGTPVARQTSSPVWLAANDGKSIKSSLDSCKCTIFHCQGAFLIFLQLNIEIGDVILLLHSKRGLTIWPWKVMWPWNSQIYLEWQNRTYYVTVERCDRFGYLPIQINGQKKLSENYRQWLKESQIAGPIWPAVWAIPIIVRELF